MDKKFDEWDSSGDGHLSIDGKSNLALPIHSAGFAALGRKNSVFYPKPFKIA